MPSKLTLSKDDVNKWQRRIELSLKWREENEKCWNRVIGYLKGEFYDELDDEDKVCVNMVRPHVNVVIPAIYSRNRDVMVNPRRMSQVGDEVLRKRAEVMKNLLRYYMKELDLKTEVKLCILDAVLTGHAWMKVGYDTEFEEVQEETQSRKTLISQFLEKIGMKEQEEVDYEEGDDLYYNTKIVTERPWALRVSPFDMIVPVLSRRVEELYWIAERVVLPYEQVMNNADFDTSGLKPSTNALELLTALRGGYNKNKIDYGTDSEYCILYEVWDCEEKKVYTLSDGYDKPLEVKDSEFTFLDSKCHPYTQMRFGEVTDEFYPQGDIKPAEPQFIEFNEVRTQMNKHRRRYNRRYAVKPGAFDPPNIAKLEKGDDGVVIEITSQYSDSAVQDTIFPIADAPLPAEIYSVEQKVRDDIFTILGTSDYSSAASEGARSATEASIIATQSRHKVEERIDIVNTFVNNIIRNIAMIAQRYMDSEQVGNVVGQDGQIYWIQMTNRREIQGEFSYDIVYGSTLPLNKEVDREQYLKFYQITRDDPYYDQSKLRLNLVRKFDLENPEAWLNPKVAEALDKQRMVAVKLGMMLQAPQNALGSNDEAGRVPESGGGERLPTGQPRGIGAARPRVPGGPGGTDLA